MESMFSRPVRRVAASVALAASIQLLSLATGAAARTVDPYELARPAIRTYTDLDGLPDNTIFAIEVDRHGYLWVGTQDGPAYYDGRVWTPIPLPTRSRSSLVRDVLAASDGAMWFATEGGGIVRLRDGKLDVFDSSTPGLNGDVVRDLAETTGPDGRTTIWAALWGGGLARWDETRWTSFGSASGLFDERVTSILPADDGGLWVGTESGLARFDDGSWSVFEDLNRRQGHRTVRALSESTSPDGRHVLWVGTDGGGLARLRGDKWTVLHQKDGLPNDQIMALLDVSGEDGRRVLLAGTFGGGLGRLERGEWSVWDPEWGFPSPLVRSLLETVSPGGTRILWVGTHGNGLVRIVQSRWRSFDTRSGLPDKLVRGIAETIAPNGTPSYWVATYGGGLARLEEGRWRVYGLADGLPGLAVTNLLATTGRDGRSALWVGTFGNGLARWENGAFRVWGTDDGLPSDRIISLLETHDPADEPILWVGTYGRGLGRLEAGRWTHYDRASGVSDIISDLLETPSSGNGSIIWAATADGLARLENGVWEMETVASGLPTNSILTVGQSRAETGRRLLWVGTRGGGVVFRDLERPRSPWKVLSDSTEPPLPSNVIYQIREDLRHRVYLFTSKGVVRITPGPNEEPSSLVTYSTEDGLPSHQCDYGASLVDSRGRIWVGTLAGAAILDPTREVVDHASKPLKISKAIAVRSGTALVANGAPLAHDDSHVAFEYTLLSFFRETETRYRVELVGFDPAPSPWTSDWKKEYTSLPAGHYQLRVWGRDFAGNVTGPETLAFEIRAAPWLTWWAFVAYAGLLLGSGWIVLRIRVASLRRRTAVLEGRVHERTLEIEEKVRELEASERRALSAKEEADQANRAKGSFLASMSHELRTPLNAIIGFIQLLEQDEGRSEREQKYFDVISSSSTHLLDLVNDVLSLAKIDAGHLALEHEPFALDRLVDDLVQVFELRAAPGVRVSADLSSTVPRRVVGDEGKLRQVLINLLGNAVKFTDRGQVDLRLSGTSDGRVRFEVADSGPGIAAEEQERLFEPFHQAAAGLRSRKGSGLGLAISRSFVRLMGGELEVDSVEGRGSTFSFEIDLSPQPTRPALETERRFRKLALDQPPVRALVADDTRENRALLAEILLQAGFEVTEAVDGAEAVARWSDVRPDVVFMDLRMPELNGEEATRRIRAIESEDATRRRDRGEPRLRRTTIVAVTASAFDEDRRGILAAGADDFIPKPFRVEAIFDVISQHLDLQWDDASPRGGR